MEVPSVQDEEVTDYAMFGVDWGFINAGEGHSELGSAAQPGQAARHNFGPGEPERFTEVRCDPSNRPLTDEERLDLEEYLAIAFGDLGHDLDERVMETCKGAWVGALGFFRHIGATGF